MRPICIAMIFVLAAAGTLSAQDTGAGGVSKGEIKEGFKSLFDGKSIDGWQGATTGYVVEDGNLVCLKGGKLMTEKEYADFIFRFDFKLQPDGNNGVGIRTPLDKNPAYHGMEIQIIDNSAEKFQKLKPYQFHGSIYGVVAAKKGFMNPPGQWNSEEIVADGSRVKVTLNDTVIVDADLKEFAENAPDGQAHPGLQNEKGFIGFLGHGARVEFRNIRIKELDKQPAKKKPDTRPKKPATPQQKPPAVQKK